MDATYQTIEATTRYYGRDIHTEHREAMIETIEKLSRVDRFVNRANELLLDDFAEYLHEQCPNVSIRTAKMFWIVTRVKF